MRYSTVKALFYDIIGDSATSPKYIGNDLALSYANMAIREITDHAKHLDRRQVILGVADQGEYNLPSDVDAMYRATYNDEKLVPVTQTRLDLDDHGWRQYSGWPTAYYLDKLNAQIGLYQKPANATTVGAYSQEHGIVVDDGNTTFTSEFGLIIDSTEAGIANQEFGVEVGEITGKAIEVFFFARPDPITSDSDSLPLPSWAGYYVLWSMLSDAYLSDTVIQDFQASQAYNVMAGEIAMRLRSRSFTKTNKTYSVNGSAGKNSRRIRRSNFPDTIPDAGTASL